jgi:hypothetical protein
MSLTLAITTIGTSKLSASSPLKITVVIPTLVRITITRIIRTDSVVVAA